MDRRNKAWILNLAATMAGAAADMAIVALSYLAAFALRLDFQEPAFGWRAVGLSCIMVCAVHLASLTLCGCYKVAWRNIRWSTLPRFFAATFMACAVLTFMRIAMPNVNLAHIRPPYSITVISFVFATVGVVAVRLVWRIYSMGRLREASLIERSELRFDNSAAAKFLLGKTVMVTGAGGSIGSEIVRQVAAAGAAKLLLVERGENALYEIDRAMRGKADAVPLMIDAGDEKRMDEVFAKWEPAVVMHAAAYKHVPMVEMNPEEGWRNNVGTTDVLTRLAAKHGAKRFVLISTDKAVNPVSAMGKTKRAAEEIVMSKREGDTSFCAVRFGNVLGSSGSVVPLFREQIANGGPVTITHPDMRRYFMTVQEAVSLVLQAASRSEQHAIYTLDMGESVKILDLAESMIKQAGMRPYIDIPIVFTGIRPGEKIFEELDVSEKSCYRTDMAKIYITK